MNKQYVVKEQYTDQVFGDLGEFITYTKEKLTEAGKESKKHLLSIWNAVEGPIYAKPEKSEKILGALVVLYKGYFDTLR